MDINQLIKMRDQKHLQIKNKLYIGQQFYEKQNIQNNQQVDVKQDIRFFQSTKNQILDVFKQSTKNLFQNIKSIQKQKSFNINQLLNSERIKILNKSKSQIIIKSNVQRIKINKSTQSNSQINLILKDKKFILQKIDHQQPQIITQTTENEQQIKNRSIYNQFIRQIPKKLPQIEKYKGFEFPKINDEFGIDNYVKSLDKSYL